MKIKGKNAISLIVLVITILVLSILAATVIISLSNTNVISEANDAVKKTEAQQIEEAKTLMYADGMLGYNPEDMIIGDTTLTWDEESKTIIEKATINGVTTVDKVTIPAGFYYVGGTKDTGLVISDNSADENKGVSYTCDGNQFVWVPVEYTATGVTDENGLDTGFTTVFKRGSAVKNSDGIYKMTGEVESYYNGGSDDYFNYTQYYEGTDREDYLKMNKAVQKYSGFYISRFEVGDGQATSARTFSSGDSTVVSKKGAILYDYVDGYKAKSLAEDMYSDSQFVSSIALYGVMWDAMLNFISDAEHDITNAKSWGNYDWSSSDTLFTGADDVFQVKNIYDVAGNAHEFTMETIEAFDSVYLAFQGNAPRDFSGNLAIRPDAYDGRSFRNETVFGNDKGNGFRVALYLK